MVAGEGLEVAGAVLLLAEHRAGHAPGRVVDVAHEREPRSAVLEPVVAGAVGLQQQALLGHAVAAAAVLRGPASARARPAGLAQQALQAASG